MIMSFSTTLDYLDYRLDLPTRYGYAIGQGVDVAPSSIVNAGNGLYAGRNFAKSAPITWFEGEILAFADAVALSTEQRSHARTLTANCEVIDGLRTPIQGLGGASFANDGTFSQANNAQFHKLFVPDTVILRATCDIAVGEEIFVSYGRKHAIYDIVKKKKVTPQLLPNI
jgi:hypothetical protein